MPVWKFIMNLETNYKIQKKGITLVIPNPCGNIKETKMKNSGIEWIGEIPDEWEVSKIGQLYEERKTKVSDTVYPPLSVTMQGILPQLETAAKSDAHDDRKLVLKGDFVINSRSDRRGSCGISEFNGSVSLINTVLHPKNEMNPIYYNWLFHSFRFSDEYYKNGHGIVDDLWTTSWTEMKKIFIPLPPKETQQRIATYLDKKCSKIEETIQNQQQVIEKLKAYKQSLITEAVTGKKYHENCHTDSILLTQNPNEDIKTEIPLGISNPCGNIEFKYCNLGFIADFKNGLNYNASDFGTEVKFLGVGDFQNYLVLNDESMFSNIITDTEIEDDYYLKNGDIIFVRSNGSKELVGRAIMVDNIDFKVTYSGFCIRLRNKEPQKINSKFLLYFFRSDYFRNELQRLSQGSNISNINQDLLSHIKIPLVDIRFQESVVDFLDKKCTAIDTVIEQKQNLIEKLTEYKKSLIYECVTGKKEV